MASASLMLGSPVFADSPDQVDAAALLTVGDQPQQFGFTFGAPLSDGVASISTFLSPPLNGQALANGLEATGKAENQPLLSTTNGIVSIGLFIEEPEDADPPFDAVPVVIQGSYQLQAGGLGGAGVRVGDNSVDQGRFAGSFLFGASCGFGIPGDCSGGTFSETALFFPGFNYSFTLTAGGSVANDTDDLKGGSYLASIDPQIFIDNSSGDFNGLKLDIGTVPDNAASAAPEPASWALLLGGCGVLGATLRRHNRRSPLTSSYLAS
jgi:hypothetical protein